LWVFALETGQLEFGFLSWAYSLLLNSWVLAPEESKEMKLANFD
jgi:hypothetical protein